MKWKSSGTRKKRIQNIKQHAKRKHWTPGLSELIQFWHPVKKKCEKRLIPHLLHGLTHYAAIVVCHAFVSMWKSVLGSRQLITLLRFSIQPSHSMHYATMLLVVRCCFASICKSCQHFRYKSDFYSACVMWYWY